MPRSKLIIVELIQTSTGNPDTRISAHTIPSTVENSNEPTVTRIVNLAPSSRKGRYSMASAKNCVMLVNLRGGVGCKVEAMQPHRADYAPRPHFFRMVSIVPLALSFARAAFTLAISSGLSLLAAIPMLPITVGL